MIVKDSLFVGTLADLRATGTASNCTVFMQGRDTAGDGFGGFYHWVAGSTQTEDAQGSYYNSSVDSSGQWVRLFQRVRAIPQGYVIYIGTFKIAVLMNTTDSNGRITDNLTFENTAGGTAIFSTILWYDAKPLNSTTDTATMYSAALRGGIPSDRKTISHQFLQPNVRTIVLSLLYAPFLAASNGIPTATVVIGM